MVLFVILAGYLIIYNIFNISVKTDIRAYGLLKNVGTTGKQLKKIVRMQRGDYQLLVFQSDCFVVILQVFAWLRP